MSKKQHCKGTKKDGTPCMVNRGLDENGFCHRCRKGKPADDRPELPSRRLFWDKNEPMPKAYDRRLFPCASCRRVLLHNGGQAVGITRQIRDKKGAVATVLLRCRECSHEWTMPDGRKKQFAFLRDVPCEVCGGKSHATSTKDRIQYRKCDDKECAHKFHQVGLERT